MKSSRNSNGFSYSSADADIRIEFLVPIKQTEYGVEVSFIPKIGHSESDSAVFDTKVISDRELSSDCGDQFFRCKPLLVTTQITSSYVDHNLLVPLNGGLLLMELQYSTKSSKMAFGSYRILESTGCSPTAVFKVYDSYYTMCTNLQNRQISVYEVRLNGTSIQQARLLGPLGTEFSSSGGLDGFTSSDVMNMSNFLLSTDIPHQPLIYFAIDNYLFAIALLDNSPYDQFRTIGANCRYIHRLARASTAQLLAYCSTEYVYYNTEQQQWLSEHSYTDSGIPYLCPNETYGVNAYKNYLKFTIGSRKGTISNVNTNSGMCINGTRGESFFVYIDKTADTVFLVNLTSAGRMPISTSGCASVDCLPIILVEDQYLVIRQSSGVGRVMVLDIATNFSTIISANHETPEMLTVVRDKVLTYPLPPRRAVTTQIVGGIAAAAVIVVIVVVVSVIMLVGYILLKRHSG